MTTGYARAAVAATCLVLLPASAALARNGGGGNSYGESYYNDMQRNPRLIEPGGDRGRYISYYGREGFDARQAAAGRPYRGQVYVRPYGAYGYGY